MVDFIKILKKAINAKSHSTPQLREQIYERAVETLEHKLVEAQISKVLANVQRQALRSAIIAVEEEYEAIEKERFSSLVGWNWSDTENDHKNKQSFATSQDNNSLVFVLEKEQEASNTSSTGNEILDKPSVKSKVPNAEPVNMDAFGAPDAHQAIQKNKLEDIVFVSASQSDNSHIVSRIFSQALEPSDPPSKQRHTMIALAAFIGCVLLLGGIFFVGGHIFGLNSNQSQREKVQVTDVAPKAVVANRKLTQRLLEDGSEIDVGLIKEAEHQKNGGISKVVATTNNLKQIEQWGEAVLYKVRTDHDAEKVATGNVRWSLIKEPSVKEMQEELAVRGNIVIPDEGLSLQLTLRRNTDASLFAAYIIDLIFIFSDNFSDQSIKDIQTLTFKASEQSVGQVLTGTVVTKIDNNFFLFVQGQDHPFLEKNLQLMRKLDWIRLVMTDKNGRVNELTFEKGPKGKALFNEVIEKWLEQTDKQRTLH